MTYEIQVDNVWCNLDEECPSYSLSLKTDKFYFFIEEPYCYSDEEIDSLLERKERGGIGGGGKQILVFGC